MNKDKHNLKDELKVVIALILHLKSPYWQAQPNPQLNETEAELALFSLDPDTHHHITCATTTTYPVAPQLKFISQPI
jgi:hypothetical protein